MVDQILGDPDVVIVVVMIVVGVEVVLKHPDLSQSSSFLLPSIVAVSLLQKFPLQRITLGKKQIN